MPKSPADILQQLRQVAERRGVKMTNLGDGHIQLQGPHLLVNYYPFSKKKTAYVAGTTQGVPNCDAQRAVAMARNLPEIATAEARDKRPNGTRKIRYEMLNGRETCKCHWCPTIIDLDTSTLDHVIPLARGGLDHSNNRVLSCGPCNWARGDLMPELKKWPAEQAISEETPWD